MRRVARSRRSVRRTACLTAAAAALLALTTAGSGTAARAQQIIIGTGGQANAFPLGTSGGSSAYFGEFQQVYAAGAFGGSGPFLITEIAFASRQGAGAYSFTGTLGLGTTAATPASPGTNFALNKGPDFLTVFAGTQNAALTGTGATFDLVFTLTAPFLYQPGLGNLLLDVVVSNVTSAAATTGFDFGGSEPAMGRVFNLDGIGPETAGPASGLRTRFVRSPASVPEPGTLALLGLCGTGLLLARGRRRQQ